MLLAIRSVQPSVSFAERNSSIKLQSLHALPFVNAVIGRQKCSSTDFVNMHTGFCDETQWILQRNALDFATKRTGFCNETHWILRQNALDFVTKRTGFCNKTHWILQQNAVCFVSLAMSHVFNVHL